jgi:hypothetical protein
LAAEIGMDCESNDIQPRSVKLIDHVPDDLVAVLGNHADAVPLAKMLQEVVIRPRKLKRVRFDAVHIGIVAADHPADKVNFHFAAPIETSPRLPTRKERPRE